VNLLARNYARKLYLTLVLIQGKLTKALPLKIASRDLEEKPVLNIQHFTHKH